jgi:hypothetical protein
MSDAVQTKRLKAVHISPEDGKETPLGELEFGDQGRLSLVKAEEKYRKFLTDFIAAVNRQATLVMKSPPEKGEGRYELAPRIYKRSSPDFYRGLRNYARCYYALALTSDEDEQQAPQVFEELT